MKGSKSVLLALLLSGLAVTPASAQSTALERMLERLGRTVDGVMSNIGSAFDRDDGEWTQAADGFSWSGRVPNGGTLEIKGVNGPIMVEAARGRDVVVTAQARGRRTDPSTVQIELVEHEGGLTFCAVYPTPDDARRENFCAPGSDGQMNTSRNDVEVRFHVQLPEGVPFVGRTVNGDVEALAIDSDVELATVNGDVVVSTSGFAEATTVNGSIDAAIGTSDLRSGLSFSTVNGDITIDVPDGIDADVNASWVNGELDSDLPVRLQGRISRNRARGTIGDGGPELDLKTVNGSIRIR